MMPTTDTPIVVRSRSSPRVCPAQRAVGGHADPREIQLTSHLADLRHEGKARGPSLVRQGVASMSDGARDLEDLVRRHVEVNERLPGHFDGGLVLRRRHLLDSEGVELANGVHAAGTGDDRQIRTKVSDGRHDRASVGERRKRDEHRARAGNAGRFENDALRRITVDHRQAGQACLTDAAIVQLDQHEGQTAGARARPRCCGPRVRTRRSRRGRPGRSSGTLINSSVSDCPLVPEPLVEGRRQARDRRRHDHCGNCGAQRQRVQVGPMAPVERPTLASTKANSPT